MKDWLYCVALMGVLAGDAARATEQAPNVIMIVVDDLRHDEFGAGGHPYLETPNIDLLVRDGAMFSRAYHVTPLCSPNRASILTGQYPSRHGIIDNTARPYASRRLEVFPKKLQQAGYVTAHIGKWHMGNDPTPQPGYDHWVSFPGQGKMTDPDLYEDGRLHQVRGYMTDILTDRAVEFISQTKGRPFFLFLAHKAVHPESTQREDASIDLQQDRAFTPSPRHAGRYEKETIRRSPNYGFSDDERRTKPVLSQALEFKHSKAIAKAFIKVVDEGVSEDTVRRRAEMILSIDEGLGRLMEALEARGELEHTFIVFTSDNGYFYGEHGLSVERRLPYEEAVRAPLLVRYPKLVRAGAVIDALAMSIDLAPTVLEIAGVPVPPSVQGKSLAAALEGGSVAVHEAVLIEHFSNENPFPWTVNLDYRAVRKGNYKYIRWIRFEDEAELYDLEKDPYERRNLIRSPTMQPVIEEMKVELRRLVVESMGLDR